MTTITKIIFFLCSIILSTIANDFEILIKIPKIIANSSKNGMGSGINKFKININIFPANGDNIKIQKKIK